MPIHNTAFSLLKILMNRYCLQEPEGFFSAESIRELRGSKTEEQTGAET
jgi:hypothetical protein